MFNKKESKKDLTKEVKDGKTLTGKKVASVDVNPTIKEKTKYYDEKLNGGDEGIER